MNGEFFPLTLSGFPGYRVDLLAGGEVIAQDENSLAGSIDDGKFGTSTVPFITGSTHPQLGQALSIRLVNLNQVDPMFPGSAEVVPPYRVVRRADNLITVIVTDQSHRIKRAAATCCTWWGVWIAGHGGDIEERNIAVSGRRSRGFCGHWSTR